MKPITEISSKTLILDGFWGRKQALNSGTAIFHQWEQLVQSGCIDNFRILAEGKPVFREGWFFADSDAYKWLDAASRIYARVSDAKLSEIINNFIALLEAAQAPDGYLYTYNQIHFPNTRWENLQIEHELYCHGHLIEAAIAHYQATGEERLYNIGIKAADRIVADFSGKGPKFTPGHQEIEIALLRLFEVTANQSYIDLAEQFIEKRGRFRLFAPTIFQQNLSVDNRTKIRNEMRLMYEAEHPDYRVNRVPAGNKSKKPAGIGLRFILNALSGKYLQQHRPVRRLTVPVGHAVRFAYLAAGGTYLAAIRDDQQMLSAMESAWDRMVEKRMYVTGGIGSLPVIEGFGRDYELDPSFAYAETCAALGCMFWNWEMTRAQGKPKFADLFERQLYNASAVGMGRDGKTYLYNNPLVTDGGVTRKTWYEIPCCPSNLSRTWAGLDRYICTTKPNEIFLHQYISSRISLLVGVGFDIEIQSGFPFSGLVNILFHNDFVHPVKLNLRIPSWTDSMEISLNGSKFNYKFEERDLLQTASGYSPYLARTLPIERKWQVGDQIEMQFGMPILVTKTHPKVKSTRGMGAITRGPLVYCLESIDNPGINLEEVFLVPGSLKLGQLMPDLDGAPAIHGETEEGKTITAIPYYLWGNRGQSHMSVYMRTRI